jgi:uncharacterized protein YjbI with pentapeptide repeats
MSPAAFVELVRAGSIDTSGVQVTGDLDLDGMVVKHALICRDCHFRGLSLHRTVFSQILDLSGSTIADAADISDARFLGPALFGPTPTSEGSDLCPTDSTGVRFRGGANFSLVTFGGLAMFAGAQFEGPADFTLTRFQGDAIFALGCALKQTLFDRSTFAASADFGAYRFNTPPVSPSASFADVAFRGRTDFSQAIFTGGAMFDRARFEQGASFQGATLGHPKETMDPVYTFVGTTSAGPLDFSFAKLKSSMNLEDVNAAGVLSLKDATFDPTCATIDHEGNTVSTSRCISIDSLSAGALRMDVTPVLQNVQTSQRGPILDLIESSAKARGDLAQANDAHYQRQVLASRKDSEPERILDVVFYRTIAGYFVRPLNPLLCLLALAGVIALVRTGRGSRPVARNGGPVNGNPSGSTEAVVTNGRDAPTRRLVALPHRATHAVASFTVELMGTLSLIGQRSADADESPWKRIEIYAYRVLLVLVLIGFANSNPTLRQMLDALL